MKNLLTYTVLFLTAFFLFRPEGLCTSYYVDEAGGNDSNDGLSAKSAWQTLGKVNAGRFQAGDNILFRRDQTFYGSLQPSADGVTYSAYGTGNMPVISGITLVTGWTSIGNGVYAAACPSCTNSMTMLSINDSMKAMGRYPNISAPNGGYLTISSHVGNTAITDSTLPPFPDWTGAEIVIKKNSYTLDRGLISGQAGQTLTYASIYGSGVESQDGYGYFLQNSPLTLDQFGEWYYDPTAKMIRVFFGNVSPAQYTVKAGTIDTLVYLNGYNNVTFTGLAFQGSTAITLGIENAANIAVRDCSIAYSGFYAIKDSNSTGLVISGCSITNTNNTAIEAYACNGAVLTRNMISHTGMMPGMGGRNGQPYKGIAIFGNSNYIAQNNIDSTGYMGIFFYGDSTIARYDYVNYFGTVLDDGGGIYTYAGNAVGRIISNNIVLYGIGSPAGTTSGTGAACGLYADDQTSNLEMDSNTAAYCVRAGIYLHNTHETGVRNNTLFSNGTQLLLVHDAVFPADSIRNLVVKGNVFFSELGDQLVSYCSSTTMDFSRMGVFDSNSYTRPFDTAGIVATTYNIPASTIYDYYDLSGWRMAYQTDTHSTPGPHLVPYTIVGQPGANLFTNGSFNSNTNGAFCLSGPGSCAVTWSAGGHLDGGSAQVSYNTSGGPNASLGVYFSLGAVQAGQDYIIRFSLQGANTINNTFQLFLLRSSQPGSNHSVSEYYALTSSRTENQYLYHSLANETVTLCMVFTQTDTTFWVDNVKFSPVTVTRTNPNDSMLLVYNQQYDAATFPLDGNYEDGNNHFYLSKIRLRPFGSAALVKLPASYVIPYQPPVADAGPDTTYQLNIPYLVLDASASFDPQGGTLTYSWQQLSGPSQVTLVSSDSVRTPVSIGQPGSYTFQVTVADDHDLSASATVTIVVTNNNLPAVTFAIFPNPSTGILHFQLIDSTDGPVGIQLFDAGGRTVGHILLMKVEPLLESQIDVSNMGRGLYYFRLIRANGARAIKSFLKL